MPNLQDVQKCKERMENSELSPQNQIVPNLYPSFPSKGNEGKYQSFYEAIPKPNKDGIRTKIKNYRCK